MKRLFCVLLILSFLIVSVSAATTTQEKVIGETKFTKGTAGTFWGLTWDPPPDNARYNNIGVSFWVRKADVAGSLEGAIAKIKKATEVEKPGRFGILPEPTGNGILDDMFLTAENYIWWEKGVKSVKTTLTEYAKAAKKAGVDINYMLGDYERGMSNWHIGTEDAAWSKYEAIYKDPRFKTEILPLLTKAGFVMPDDQNTNPLYSVCYCEKPDITNSKYGYNYNIFNYVMLYRLNMYLQDAVYLPFKESYPNVKFSNYMMEVDPKFDYRDINGHKIIRQLVDPNFYFVGTGIGSETYGWIKRIKTYRNEFLGPPKFYPYKEFSWNPYNGFMYAVQGQVCSYMTIPQNIKFTYQPWIAYENWPGDPWQTSKHALTDYYDEVFFHCGLLNPDPFFLWFPSAQFGTVATDWSIASELMLELDEVAGFSDRRVLTEWLTDAQVNSKWGKRYFLSGLEAGGRNIWRITPDITIPGMTKDAFLVSQNPITFRVGNQEVIFPTGSKILAPSSQHSNFGWWVESPKGTYPTERINNRWLPAPDPTDDPLKDGEGPSRENRNTSYPWVKINGIGPLETYPTPHKQNTNYKEINITIDNNIAKVNGKDVTLDQSATILNSRTVVPARFIAESLGATVAWDGNTRTVTITKDTITIIIQIDNNIAKVNGKDVTLDQSATILNGRTVVPARFIAESLGAYVEWNANTKTVTITK